VPAGPPRLPLPASAEKFAAGVPAGPPRLALPPHLLETAPELGRFTSVAGCLRRSPHNDIPEGYGTGRRAFVTFNSARIETAFDTLEYEHQRSASLLRSAWDCDAVRRGET
jgi:hypothetical protein